MDFERHNVVQSFIIGLVILLFLLFLRGRRK